MYGTYVEQQPDNNQSISKIRAAIKFASDNFNTRKVNKESNQNYGGYLNKSYELESFLNSTFNISYDMNSLISYIIDKGLFDIILKLPELINNSFNTFDLSLNLEDKYDGDKWVVVSIFTSLDGNSASDILEKLEEEIFNTYGDRFLNNVLLSVEFE